MAGHGSVVVGFQGCVECLFIRVTLHGWKDKLSFTRSTPPVSIQVSQLLFMELQFTFPSYIHLAFTARGFLF